MAFQVFSQKYENFITVSGDKLMDGDKEFRFISFNIPNLNYVEDEMTFTKIQTYSSGETNYAYWHPKIYSSGSMDLKYLKILFNGEAQIARVEILYN